MTSVEDTNPGDRVRLVSTSDPYTKLEPGALGTVHRVVESRTESSLFVRWDDGSRLSLIEGEDEWDVVTE